MQENLPACVGHTLLLHIEGMLEAAGGITQAAGHLELPT